MCLVMKEVVALEEGVGVLMCQGEQCLPYLLSFSLCKVFCWNIFFYFLSCSSSVFSFAFVYLFVYSVFFFPPAAHLFFTLSPVSGSYYREANESLMERELGN